MAETQGNKLGFFGKIRQEEDAVKIVRAASLAFLAVGCFFMIVSIWHGPEVWVHGIAYVVLGFLLRQFRSRVIASLLVLLGLVTVLLQLRVFSGHPMSAGLSIIVAAIVVFLAVRAMEATMKLRARKAAAGSEGPGSTGG